MEAFTEMLALLVVALEDNPEQDFLGELYMCLGLGNDHSGQFFTPYHICEVMSAVTTPTEEFQQKIGDRGWVAVCDPTCGAGALLVAFANECRKKGINYQTNPAEKFEDCFKRPFHIAYGQGKELAGALGEWLCFIVRGENEFACIVQQIDGVKVLQGKKYTAKSLEAVLNEKS